MAVFDNELDAKKAIMKLISVFTKGVEGIDKVIQDSLVMTALSRGASSGMKDKEFQKMLDELTPKSKATGGLGGLLGLGGFKETPLGKFGWWTADLLQNKLPAKHGDIAHEKYYKMSPVEQKTVNDIMNEQNIDKASAVAQVEMLKKKQKGKFGGGFL